MPTMPSAARLKQMIEEALKARDPKGHLQAKASGTLDEILSSRAEAAMQTFEQMMADADPRIDSLATLGDQLREQESASRAAAEAAIAQATEFAETNQPDPTEE